MAFQLGALNTPRTELVKQDPYKSGSYSNLFSQMNRNQEALGQREDRATLNALGSARAEAIMAGQAGSAKLQGIREAQTKALDAKNIPLYDKLTGELKAQMQIESAEAKADPFGKTQMARKRAENVGRGRGVTGNAQSVQAAIQAQAPYEAKLNILENELNSMKPTEEGYKENYDNKFSEYQMLVGEHDKLAFTEAQKWGKKHSTRKTSEELQEDKRKQAEEKRKQGTYANVDFKDFRKNFQDQNKDIIKSAGVAKGIAPLIKSASKGNTQSVATIVKRMSRMASNEAIVMPELQLGFSGNAKDQIEAWGDTYLGSGNRIPEKDLINIKVAYNAMASQYNDTLGDAVDDGVADWKRYSNKAKGMSTSSLKRQMFGKDYKEIPIWTDVISYKKLNPNSKDNSNTSKKRDQGEIKSPDNLTDRERLDIKLKKLMGGE
jgi:hypothetical protein